MKKLLTVLTLSFTSFVALSSHNLTLGQDLPTVVVDDKGYVEMIDGEIGYRHWTSDELEGKVIMIQHIAGRMSAKELNAPMIDALKQAKFPLEKYNTATLVNLDEAIWGTGSLVASELRSNKEEFPDAIFVIDEEGKIRSNWDLVSKSSAIILLDKTGKVIFVKDGEMSANEIKQVISLIEQNI